MSLGDKVNGSNVQLNELVEKHVKLTKFGRKAGLILGGAIAIGSVADGLLGMAKNARAHEQEKMAKKQGELQKKKQLKNSEEKNVAYYDMMQFNNYLQDLHKQRSGSSNTYGGKRY